ncbi:hypothetical protein BUE80_DR011024 [Diplocarpon rosae]|nr:hypothetical protein BUE80_DR011024 [Diplocarpon rosae]
MEPVKEKPRRQPVWIPAVQAVQVSLSVVILGLSAWLIHGKYFDPIGFAIFCVRLPLPLSSILLPSCGDSRTHRPEVPPPLAGSRLPLPHGILPPPQDLPPPHHPHRRELAPGVLFWLAAMGATAHLRSTFKYSVSVYGCYEDGSSVDSSTCVVGERAAVATKMGTRIMSAIAGLSALEMYVLTLLRFGRGTTCRTATDGCARLLFAATLVSAVVTWYPGHSKVSERSSERPPAAGRGVPDVCSSTPATAIRSCRAAAG